jgi:hypothetical protein
MSSIQRRISSTIAILVIFATAQVYLGVSLAASKPAVIPLGISAPAPQQPAGVLTISGGNAITVNGTSAATGATILDGASIETPAGVGANVAFGGPGSLKIEPDAKLTLELRDGSIKVMLLKGCITLRTKKGTAGEIDTSAGVAGKTDVAKDGVLRVCAPGAVATAPAAAGGGGLSGVAIAAIIGGGVGVIAAVLGSRGSNPSPAIP